MLRDGSSSVLEGRLRLTFAFDLLKWRERRRGLRVLLLDRHAPALRSKIAPRRRLPPAIPARPEPPWVQEEPQVHPDRPVTD